MNREEAARVLISMRDTLKKVYLVAIDEERVSALESAVSYLLADDNNVPVKQPDPITGLDTDTTRPGQNKSKAVCPRCGKYMTETGFTNAGVIQCSLHAWQCKECGIRREQAYDWPNFQPQEWHRPTYSIKGGEWIGEDETEKLKAALDTLPPLPKVDAPFGFERIGGDWEETAE